MRFTMHIDFEAENLENAVALKEIMFSQLEHSPMQFPVRTVVLTNSTDWSHGKATGNAEDHRS